MIVAPDDSESFISPKLDTGKGVGEGNEAAVLLSELIVISIVAGSVENLEKGRMKKDDGEVRKSRSTIVVL